MKQLLRAVEIEASERETRESFNLLVPFLHHTNMPALERSTAVSCLIFLRVFALFHHSTYIADNLRHDKQGNEKHFSSGKRVQCFFLKPATRNAMKFSHSNDLLGFHHFM